MSKNSNLTFLFSIYVVPYKVEVVIFSITIILTVKMVKLMSKIYIFLLSMKELLIPMNVCIKLS